mmetsp:Transcript_18834/g.60119  ORF Transcript_18834/g.60119 Transcript_18834/m.60119 type:complete len:286 (+) Transcript_18834:1539-2396(+)
MMLSQPQLLPANTPTSSVLFALRSSRRRNATPSTQARSTASLKRAPAIAPLLLASRSSRQRLRRRRPARPRRRSHPQPVTTPRKSGLPRSRPKSTPSAPALPCPKRPTSPAATTRLLLLLLCQRAARKPKRAPSLPSCERRLNIYGLLSPIPQMATRRLMSSPRATASRPRCLPLLLARRRWTASRRISPSLRALSTRRPSSTRPTLKATTWLAQTPSSSSRPTSALRTSSRRTLRSFSSWSSTSGACVMPRTAPTTSTMTTIIYAARARRSRRNCLRPSKRRTN